MAKERLILVTYDISDRKRWRRVFGILKGYGRWLQLSVFQCRLADRQRIEMTMKLEGCIKPAEDHILILDLGPADSINPRIESIGKSYEAPTRQATIF